MILQVFCVYDKVVNAYLPPFFARSKGEAVRSFTDAVNDQSHQFSKHVSDYVLVYLGEWNDNNALFISREPQRLFAANEVLNDEVFTADTEEDKAVRHRVVM